MTKRTYSPSYNNRKVTDHSDKAEAVNSFFEGLLGSSTDRPFSLNLDYLGLPSMDLRQIDGVFSVEEVLKAIKDMPLDKCPGPDGFSARFFVLCWDIIKVDVMAAFNSLSRLDSRGFGAVNNVLITLLPKKPGVEEVRDFRPISLIHGVAKLVAKVIANCLAPHLPQLVGAHQSAFVHGRCLHDNFMMVQGNAHKLQKYKQLAILISHEARHYQSLRYGGLVLPPRGLEEDGFWRTIASLHLCPTLDCLHPRAPERISSGSDSQ
jgi:hypothetical protein